MRKIILAGGAALALALPAHAQNNTSQRSASGGQQSGGQQQSASGQNSQDAVMTRQRVRQDLEQAGFTQVQVMPQSFLVRARDKQNRPVLMVIDQDSMMAFTALGTSGASGGNQNMSGSGGSSGSGSSGSGASGSGSSSR